MVKETTHDMTKGPLLKELVLFTVPLILATLLQLTYNATDSMIVGRFVGKTALAAVGTTNPLLTLIILFTNGICLGAGILVGTLYGAHKIEALRRQVSTGMIAGLVFSAVLITVMMAAARPLLVVLQVRETFLDEACLYMRIVLPGILFSFIYNYMSSTLRAMGDSVSPLIFLGISAGLNIVGDIFFILVLGMGIEGAAISTVLCEALSAVLCLVYSSRRVPALRLGRAWLVFDRGCLKKTVSYGIVSALQQSSVQLGKLGTQGIVNTLGVDVTAAFNAVNRFDDYAMVPQQNLAHGITAVMAQNRGAGNMKRMSDAFRIGMIMEVAYGAAIGVITWLFARPLVSIFSTDPAVIAEGAHYLKIIALMYPFPALTNGVQGYFRGIGDLRITLYSTIINMGLRVAAGFFFVFGLGYGFESVPWSYLVGWISMLAFEVPFLVREKRKNGR